MGNLSIIPESLILPPCIKIPVWSPDDLPPIPRTIPQLPRRIRHRIRRCGPPVIDQTGSNTGTAVTSLVVTMSGATATGCCVVVSISVLTTTVTISSVTDSGGSSYSQQGSVANGTTVKEYLWSATSGLSSTTVTINFSASVTASVTVASYTGVLGVVVPGSNGASGTSTSASITPSSLASTDVRVVIGVAAQGLVGASPFSASTGSLRVQANATLNGSCINDNTSASWNVAIANAVTLNASQAWAVVAVGLVVGPCDIGGGSGNTNTVSTVKFTTGAQINVGSTVVVAVTSSNSAPPIVTSVSDSTANVYVKAVAQGSSGGGFGPCGVEIWYCLNIPNAIPGSTVFTANTGSQNGNTCAILIRYFAPGTVGSIGQTATNTGSTQSGAETVSLTTIDHNNVVVVAIAQAQTGGSPTSFTAQNGTLWFSQTSAVSAALGGIISNGSSTAASVTGSCTSNASAQRNWGAVAIELRSVGQPEEPYWWSGPVANPEPIVSVW